MLEHDNLQKQLEFARRRLYKLEELKAIKGIDTPPETIIDLEETQKKIAELENRLGIAPTTPPVSTHPGPQPLIIATPKWDRSPFPGLVSFKKADATIFFGRERETDELVKKVAESRFVAVVGASGSGKSSLVGAGLLPRLEANAINSDTTQSKDWLLPDFERGKGWSGLRFTPGELGDNPFLALATKLAPMVEDTPFDLTLKLKENDQECSKQLLQALEGKPQSAEILLFIDQFEELFTIVKHEETIAAFCRLLTLLAKQPRIRVVVTMELSG